MSPVDYVQLRQLPQGQSRALHPFPSAIESLTKIEVRLKGGGKAKQAVHRMAGDAMYVGAKVRASPILMVLIAFPPSHMNLY